MSEIGRSDIGDAAAEDKNEQILYCLEIGMLLGDPKGVEYVEGHYDKEANSLRQEDSITTKKIVR